MDKQNIPSGEKGAAFITVLVILIITAIILLMAVEPYTTVMQREKEAELVFRGEQICEALRNYQKDHGGGFPVKLEDLLKQGPNHVPYLRRLFKNPFDPEGKWRYLATGTTAVVTKEDGTKEILPGGGVVKDITPGQEGNTGEDENSTTDSMNGGKLPRKAKMLPFRLDGKEGQPILGVYAKFDKEAFRKYLDSTDISEWYFSPLVIVPKPPINLNPTPAQPRPDPGDQGGDRNPPDDGGD
jgi:hypothetical protein